MSHVTSEFRTAALRRGLVLRSNRTHSVAPELSMMASVELLQLGFLVNAADLQGMSVKDLEATISSARLVIGADRSMAPIYKGFPQQVEALDTLTLLVEQIMHYWTGGAFLPSHPTVVREGLPLEEMLGRAREVKVVTAGAAALEVTRGLATNAIAMSEDDRALLAGAVTLATFSLEDVRAICADARNGENMQAFVSAVAARGLSSASELVVLLAPTCDNADQLLRLVLAVGSDVAGDKWLDNYVLASQNLADRHFRSVRMAKLSRPARRAIVARLGEVTKGFKADSLVARRGLWRVVLRAVHPYDFSLTEGQRRAADIVHENVEYRTFNSMVETAMGSGDVVGAVELLRDNQPGNLLRRTVALLRLVSTAREARALADGLGEVGSRASLTTLVSAYNGILSANSDAARVNRVAGLNNKLLERKDVKKVDERHLQVVLASLDSAIVENLKGKSAPEVPVGIESSAPVPLVRRDASTSDRVLDRGQALDLVGEGETIRIFGHWRNNQSFGGYMDIGVVVLDDKCVELANSTWNTWNNAREWSTYSGDCYVVPGAEAAEYIDVKVSELKKLYPSAKYAAMTVQSWTGWPMADVDFIAGAMLRKAVEKGEVFEPRTVSTAFKPTTKSTQAVPFVVDLESGQMVWIDSSNGSTASHVSSSHDATVGPVVYDELVRPRLTMGDLARMWAEAHGVETADEAVDRDVILGLLD